MFSLNPHHPVIVDMAVCIGGGGKWSDLFQFLIKSLNTNASEGKALLNLKKNKGISFWASGDPLCANHMPDRIIRIPYTGELFSSFL